MPTGKESHETKPRNVGPAYYYENTNNSGQRMIDLCEATDLRIAHSHFLNRKARLYNYDGPKGDQQQLEHIMIRSKWWKSITNCCAYNTIDICSDHRLEYAYIRLSIHANKQASDVRCQYNWAKLSEPLIQRTFDLEISNRFDSLKNGATISNDTISQVQKQADAFDKHADAFDNDAALKHASEKVLGKKPKNKHAGRVSPQTIELLNTRNKAAKRYKRNVKKFKKQLLKDQVSAALILINDP